WGTAPGQPRVPLMLGLRARKPVGVPMVQVDAFTDRMFSGNPAAVCVLDSCRDFGSEPKHPPQNASHSGAAPRPSCDPAGRHSGWPLAEATMQAIATENNLSETSFIHRVDDGYAIRWFTPAQEIDLCGHATLASAFVVLDPLEPERGSVVFHSAKHGPLSVRREPGSERLVVGDPADPPRRVERFDPELARALGAAPVELWLASYWLVVFQSEAQVRSLRPDLVALAHARPGEVIVTAPADDPQIDFVSRFFGP